MSTDTPKAPAFILGAALPRFSWTVRIPVPVNDSYVNAELPLIFQAVDEDELDRMRGIGLAPEQRPPTESEIVAQVVVGWPELRDAAGNNILFSPSALAMVMQSPMVRTATVATFLAAMSGTAIRKNV